MSQKTRFSSEFLAIFGACVFALASCGGSSSWPKQETLPPSGIGSPDAQVIIVYVTPDAAPPSAATTCACVCADPCTCSCDCGTGQPIAVLMPGCTTPANDDAAPPPPQEDAGAPAPDAPIAAVNRDAANADTIIPSGNDALIVKNDVPPDLSADKDATVADVVIVANDARPDIALPADAEADKAATRADTQPDSPPDTKPCSTATCRCPVNSVCKPTYLMSLPSISDYASLGHSYFVGVQSGFGIYQSDPVTSNWLSVALQIAAGAAPTYEVDVNYNAISKSLGGVAGAFYAVYYDWFSLLRQFSAQIDACGCTGLSFDLKGNISSPRPEATFRITLSDTVCKNADGSPAASDGGTGSDEQWWYDIAQTDILTDWKTLQIPIDSFRLGSVRYNDGKLDLRCLNSFELNYQYNVSIYCTPACIDYDITTGTGHFEVRNLTTY